MVGMLPGVECARRRRLHQSGGSGRMATHNSARRSFSLYAPSNTESLLSSSSYSSLLPRSILNEAYPDPDDKAAREAKQRLDDKFNTQRRTKSQNNHNHNRKSYFDGLCRQFRSECKNL